MSCYTAPVVGWGISRDELEKAIDPKKFGELGEDRFDGLESIGMLVLQYTDEALEGDEGPSWLLLAGYPWENFAFNTKKAYIENAYTSLKKRGLLRAGFTARQFANLQWGNVCGTITG